MLNQRKSTLLAVLAILLLPILLWAANPTFNSFDANFTTSGSGSAQMMHLASTVTVSGGVAAPSFTGTTTAGTFAVWYDPGGSSASGITNGLYTGGMSNVFFGGTITISAGASDGFVATSDHQGRLTWAAPSVAGFSTVNPSQFSVTGTGLNITNSAQMTNINVTGWTNLGNVFTAAGKKFEDNAGQVYVTGGSHIGALFKSSGGTIYWATNSDGSANEPQFFNPGFGLSQDNTGYEWLHDGGSVSLDTHQENSFAGTNMYPFPASKTALIFMGDSITASQGRPSYPYVLRTNYQYYTSGTLLLFTNQAVAGDNFTGQTNKFWTSTYPILQALGLDHPGPGTNVIISMMIGRNDSVVDYNTYIYNYSNTVALFHSHGWQFMGITILPATAWLNTTSDSGRWMINQALLFNGTAPTIDTIDGTDYSGATNGIPCDYIMDAAKVLPDCQDSATNSTHKPTYAPDGTHPMAYGHQLLAKEWDRAFRYRTQRVQEPVERVGQGYNFYSSADGTVLARLADTSGAWVTGVIAGTNWVGSFSSHIGMAAYAYTNNTLQAAIFVGSPLASGSTPIVSFYSSGFTPSITAQFSINNDGSFTANGGTSTVNAGKILFNSGAAFNMLQGTNQTGHVLWNQGADAAGGWVFNTQDGAGNFTNWVTISKVGLVGVTNLIATNNVTALVSMTSPQYIGAENSISGSNIDWATGTHFYKTLAASIPFAFANSADTETIVVTVTGDASHVVTWPAAVKWSGGSAPTQTLSKTDVYTFLKVNGSIYGNSITNF